MTHDTREQAYNVFQDVSKNIYDYVDNFVLHTYMETSAGVCAEFAMNYDSNTYVYFGCLFDDAEIVVTIDRHSERFHLSIDETNDMLTAIQY